MVMTHGNSYEDPGDKSGRLWPEFYEAQTATLFDFVISTINEGIARVEASAKSKFEQYYFRDIARGEGDFSGAASFKLVLRNNTSLEIAGIHPRKITIELPTGLLVPIKGKEEVAKQERPDVANMMAIGVAIILVGEDQQNRRIFVTRDRLFRYERGKEYTLIRTRAQTDDEPISDDIIEAIIDLNSADQEFKELQNTRMVTEDESGERVEVPALSLQEANDIIGQILLALKYSTVQDQSPD
jgi:hypothetical protein